MAASPEWKVYDSRGQYQAACKEIEAAALLMGLYGDGATIRWGHGIAVWNEGQEECPAGESYDIVGTTAQQRVQEYHAKVYARNAYLRRAGVAI